MIVSILQLIGFPLGKPASERGGENPNGGRAGGDNRGITRSHEVDRSPEQGQWAGARPDHAGAAAARRQEVKPQPKAGKPAAKAKPAPKAAKAAVKKAPPAKKAPAKTGAKAAVGKPTAKPVTKPAAKKAPAKAPVKAAAKPAAKKQAPAPKAKPAVKAAATKPKAVPAKTPAKASAPAGPALPRAMPPRPDAAALGAEPARATKPSARLAQITVPSMAQSVASTAAKASYVQTMSPSVLTPPPLVAIK